MCIWTVFLLTSLSFWRLIINPRGAVSKFGIAIALPYQIPHQQSLQGMPILRPHPLPLLGAQHVREPPTDGSLQQNLEIYLVHLHRVIPLRWRQLQTQFFGRGGQFEHLVAAFHRMQGPFHFLEKRKFSVTRAVTV